ncbi:hypothetical protein JI747_020245 [Chryseobacterium sp. RG1]|uniref:DUF4369 domain-containing protein n=1 Tax=Chryseobacterium tagetis TaxID=2801334 RepID=A0ABS8A7S3_9FLAO|nr:hypothetical protein [Chryseobacterium tagetis]MCA6069498.1 hypothetical protein [Chryseobacterium tagetis]
MYKSYYIIALTIFISSFYFSQTVKEKLTINLIEDGILTIQGKNDKNKYYDPELINIQFDTVKTSSIYLDENFKILKFNLKKNNVEYNRDKLVVLFNSSFCETYILAIDSENNSYKLSGFSKNDLLYFINSIKKIFHDKSSKYVLTYLKDNIQEIDFDCIYKSLKNEKFDSRCIISCAEGIRSH